MDRLFERALELLRLAEEERKRGFHDLACSLSEQALQLYLKALLLKYFGIEVKSHNLNALFGLLFKELVKVGVKSDDIMEFVRKNRRMLDFLEEAYYLGRYGSDWFDERDSEICLSVAREGIEVLKRLKSVLESLTSHGSN